MTKLYSIVMYVASKAAGSLEATYITIQQPKAKVFDMFLFKLPVITLKINLKNFPGVGTPPWKLFTTNDSAL